MSDQFKTTSGSVSGSGKSITISSRPSLTEFILIGEKLIKEQDSVKNDLKMAKSKLKKSVKHVWTPDLKLQNAFNETKLTVKQKEDVKLCKTLESKFYSIKTLCGQLTNISQHLACHVQDGKNNSTKTKTTVLALLFQNKHTFKYEIMFGTDSREVVMPVQKEPRKPTKGKKKTKNKTKTVINDGVKKMDQVYGVHVASAGSVLLTDWVIDRVKADAHKVKPEDRTVDTFANIATKYLHQYYREGVSNLTKFGDLGEVEFIFGGFGGVKGTPPSLVRVSCSLDKKKRSDNNIVLTPKKMKCASIGSGGDLASIGFYCSLFNKEEIPLGKKHQDDKRKKCPDDKGKQRGGKCLEEDDKKGIRKYLETVELTEYANTIKTWVENAVFRGHEDKNSGGDIMIRHIIEGESTDHWVKSTIVMDRTKVAEKNK